LRYETVDTFPKLLELVTAVQLASKIALDTETSGLRIYDAGFEVAGLSISVDTYRGWYVPLSHKAGKQLDREKTCRILNHALKNKKYVMHNASFDRRVLKKVGISLPIQNLALDVVMGFYAIDERWNRTLKEVTSPDSCHWRMLGYTEQDYGERFTFRGERNRKVTPPATEVSITDISPYASNDSRVTYMGYLLLGLLLGRTRTWSLRRGLALLLCVLTGLLVLFFLLLLLFLGFFQLLLDGYQVQVLHHGDGGTYRESDVAFYASAEILPLLRVAHHLVHDVLTELVLVVDEVVLFWFGLVQGHPQVTEQVVYQVVLRRLLLLDFLN